MTLLRTITTSLKSYLPAPAGPILQPAAAFALAAAIFAADSLTDLEIAAAILYVAVVLMSVRFCDQRGVIMVAVGCMALTILSYFLTPAGVKQAGLINTEISLFAVGITTYLALKIESARNLARSLAESEQLRDALIGSVSHELRTPLASIVGGVSILSQTPLVMNDPRLSGLTRGIRDEAMRLNNDIQNLLDAARITSKGLQSLRDWTDPTDLIGAAIERVRLRYPLHSFKSDLGGNLPFIQVDPVLVEQALGQIIANAAKFSPSDSTVTIGADVENLQLIISVADRGAGLTSDEKLKFGERFFRSPRHVGKIAGSGLGLWIAKTFIVSSGGTIEAVSEGEDRGTTVRVVFPAPPDSDAGDVLAQET